MAPPKKWDDESEEESSDEESVDVKPVAARRKFDDEEDSDDVADNWDEAEDSEEERAKAAKAAAAKAKADAEAAKNKKSKSQRIEEHREANRKKRIDEFDDDEESSEEDEGDRRARLRKSEQDSDLKHAEDLFSSMDMNKKRGGPKAVVIENDSKPGEAIDLSSLPLFKPTTKPQFEALSDVLVPLLRASATKPHYSIWVANFCKQICADIPSSEIKKAASGLTALSNEKMKEEKQADKSGKKTKAAKTKTSLAAGRDIGRGNADTTAYDEDGLDDGDFM